MKFTYFHLMPWTEIEETDQDWPVVNNGFVPDRVVEQVRHLRGELGHGVMNINMKIGNIWNGAVRRGMTLWASPSRRRCGIPRAGPVARNEGADHVV